MTIASEITRLQGAKADIRQAIIDKGVDVCADLTIDDYACCINDISTGSPVGTVDVLLVGGGGGGGYGNNVGGGGGGSGDVIQVSTLLEHGKCYSVNLGNGGACGGYTSHSQNGGNTTFNNITAIGGGGGGQVVLANGQNIWCDSVGYAGASGGGSVGAPVQCRNCGVRGGIAIGGGCQGGGVVASGCCSGSGGGGGPGGAGCYGNTCYGGNGGAGITSDISGATATYGGGGGGGAGYLGYTASTGGGCGGNGGMCGQPGCNGSVGGGGGGGGYYYQGGKGGDGIAIIRYKTDGSCGINSATGGTKYTCGDYTIHCFTSNGTFCITG